MKTINGFLVAAVGFCLVDLFNRSERFTFRLSPLFLALVAFCFSMTVGVLWEFFEFTCDQVMHTDMQKDYVVHEINSVSLNPDGLNTPIHVPIESVIVNGEDWTEEIDGYLDIGLIDTMKDGGSSVHGCLDAFRVVRGRGAPDGIWLRSLGAGYADGTRSCRTWRLPARSSSPSSRALPA